MIQVQATCGNYLFVAMRLFGFLSALLRAQVTLRRSFLQPALHINNEFQDWQIQYLFPFLT